MSQPRDVPLNGSLKQAESTPAVPTYPKKTPSAHKAPKTVPHADNKYPGGLSNVPPYT
jgi:hypothetical protein